MEFEEIRKRFFYEGVELASFVGRYPSLEEYPYIGEFYGGLVKSSYEWFEAELCETMRVRYLENADSKKRFSREVCYYEANFYLSREEECLTVRCDVSLRMGKKRVLASFSEEHRWDVGGRFMIKPKRLKKRRAR